MGVEDHASKIKLTGSSEGSLKSENGVRSKYQGKKVNLKEDWDTEIQEVKKRFQQIATVLIPEDSIQRYEG